ncbi:heparinase II/III family protein [Gemmatimonas sp.]|uniref:heparinase II/III domain-containing protein n=1 Tax=Gemmatimonas sp. TaxID=1962908 RepID=UPI0037C04175
MHRDDPRRLLAALSCSRRPFSDHLVLLPIDLTARRIATAPGTSLGALADALTGELTPLLHAALPIPAQKARLTRGGGRCPEHGRRLDFNPWRPQAHHCPRCARDYGGPEHDQWWAMGAQLWTAERAVHAAALHAVRGDACHRDLAVRILDTFAARYLTWPNANNALGPSHPFFSTSLESIWLINIAHALALLEAAPGGGAAQVRTLGGIVRDRLLSPSSALIASFHEGHSSRQVWNEVAVLSALTMLERTPDALARAHAPSSLLSLLQDGVLPDGSWYEGEHSHQFAHRGLWYGVQWLAAVGAPLPRELDARFHEGFVTPFAGLLPDDTLPARRDAPYAVSVRQWHWAEWCELGYAHRADVRLAGLLSRLYDHTTASQPVETHAVARACSTADAARNGPPTQLSRADCSWRALLVAAAAPVPAGAWAPTSLVQPAQGLAVLRREQAQVYVALEGGVTGGGHGHPDRLGLTLQIGAQRILDDPGTGSSVERVSHWDRSTLAPHALFVDGAPQACTPAALVAFEDRGGAGWIVKQVDGLAPGVRATRRVIVCDGYLVDVLDWESEREVSFSLAVAAGAWDTTIPAWRASVRASAGGLEDGGDSLANVEDADGAPGTVAFESLGNEAQRLVRAWYTTLTPARWTRALAPSAPGTAPVTRYLVTERGTAGRMVGVWSWAVPEASHEARTTTVATSVSLDAGGTPVAIVTTADGTTASHEPAPHGWHISLLARHARSSIDLEGWCTGAPPIDPAATRPALPALPIVAVPLVAPAVIEHDGPVIEGSAMYQLSAASYVATEEAFGGTNSPEALVSLAADPARFVIRVAVRLSRAPHPGGGGTAEQAPDNPLDNERADINADGLQLRWGDPASTAWRGGVLVVPTHGTAARVTALVPGAPRPDVTSRSSDDGWTMQLTWPRTVLLGHAIRLALAVNECPPWRERRRGQLLLQGGGGFGYLRGDRFEPSQEVIVHLPVTGSPPPSAD